MAGRPGPRTRGNAPHQSHQNKNTLSTPSSASAFGRRCSLELNRLQSQLTQQLKEDIYRLSSGQLFWDLELEGSSKTILTHRCIVAARAPKFYSEHCSGKLKDTGHGSWRLRLPSGVSVDLLGDFVRNIYTLEDPSDCETRVLSYLRQFTIGSPESETYETPQCSPSDTKDYGFCEESCEDLRISLGRSSAHYYSLVPLDDVCKPSADLLEQELEEQDELIRSFQSIKENTQVKKPSYLQLSSRQTKNSIFQSNNRQQQQTFSIVEETNQEAETCDSEDILLSCISSPCSLITPDMDPSSRTIDSGVDCGAPAEDHTISVSHPSASSPILPRDHTTSETSGLDDGKQNCTTMASISDAESDHEFPDESADMEKSTTISTEESFGSTGKEKVDIPEKKTHKVKTENVVMTELKIVEESDIIKHQTDPKTDKISDSIKVAEKLIGNISVSCHVGELTDKSVGDKMKSKIVVGTPTQCTDSVESHTSNNSLAEAAMPFCLVTSVEEYEAGQIILQDGNSGTHISTNPQFITYDVNRSSNRNSGNFFIDASSLLDENEISSGDWLQGNPAEKLTIAGVTTSCTDDHDLLEHEGSIASATLLDSNKVHYSEQEIKPTNVPQKHQSSTLITAELPTEMELVQTSKQELCVVAPNTDKIIIEESIKLEVNITDNPILQKSAGSKANVESKIEDLIQVEMCPPSKKEVLKIVETSDISIATVNVNLVAKKLSEDLIISENPKKEKVTALSESLTSEIKHLKISPTEHKPTFQDDESDSVSKSNDSREIASDESQSQLPISDDSSRQELVVLRSFASVESEPISHKLQTSVIDCKPRQRVELGTCPSVDMIRSAPAAVGVKLQDERPKSLDCSQLQQNMLPRRNTFELEADGKQLAFMRQEIEKKQGQLLFQSCIPAFSQHVTGSEGKISGNKLPLTPPGDSISDQCCYSSVDVSNEASQPFSLLIPPAAEEEINSPDSLNNDGPLENFSQENVTVNVLENLDTKDPPKQTKLVEVVRRQKYDESMPIISGGLCTSDFELEVKESPQTRRRTESTPILSGGNLALTETPTSSPRLPRKIDATAWVVDMSDPNDVKSPEVRRKRYKVLPTQLETVKASEPDTEFIRKKNSALGFYVDLSDSETKKKSPPPQVEPEQSTEEAEKKKCFFSMYVDIGDNKVKGQMPKRLERRVFSRETSREDPVEQSKPEKEEMEEQSSKEKQGFYMFIEADPPVVRRQTMSGAKTNVNRHSWNVEPKPQEEVKKHKRAQSLSIDKSFKYEDIQKPEPLARVKHQHSTQSLNEDVQTSTSELEVKPKVEYTERSEIRVMTRSMDETLTTEVKLRTGRVELEPVMESAEARKQFVRLSDLDGRGILKHEMRQPGDGRARTRKVEETSWIESKLMVRGSRALGRSKSPGSIASASFASCHSPNQDTDESELSSMQSSVDRSGLDASTEETDLSSSYPGRGGPCSRLGEDLLRMFLEEINTDVTVEVAGRRIRAHKCILSSRCQYFAAMLSGGWVESAGNVISLHGFSYHAVHFALSHIYSGTNNIPDSLSIVELATLTDMLGLEGLKEVIMYTLKVKYCHFFHKPCSVCAVGVLECLPLAAAYGLDEIYHKSLRWITKYFVRIWPSKAFASLPRELVDKCYLQHVVHMSVDSVLDTVMSCDRLLATLPSVRWAEAVFSLTSQLLEACVTFMAEHFSGVLTSDRFVSLGKELSWNISRLEDSIMAAVDCLPPEQACQSHTKLSRILTVAAAPEPPPEMQWSASFVELLERIKIRVEGVLVRLGARAMRCKAWAMLSANMRTKVQEAACLGHDPEESRRARSLSLTKRGKKPRGSSTNMFGTTPRYSGGRLIGAAPPSFDLRQVTLAMTRGERGVQPVVATVQPMPPRKAPEGCTNPDKTAAPRARQARARTATETKQAAPPNPETTATGRPKTWPMKVLEQNKTRTTQKPSSDGSSTTASRTATPEKSTVPARVKASSSESSRTSSPASRDKTRKGPAPRKPIEPMKSASSSHIPIASSKPFLSPVLRGSREAHDSPTSKSVSELTRTKNSPIPALRSRIMCRSSQPSLADRRLSSGSIKLNNNKSSVVSSPSKPTAALSSHQNSPLRKAVLTKSESPKPPFRLGTSTDSLRKASSLAEKPKSTLVMKHTTLQSQENVHQSPKFDVRASPRARRLTEQSNIQDKNETRGPRKSVLARAPIPLSQSSSAPAINKGFKPKLLSNTSRSGTFLKDEPTVLKKPIM